LPEDSDLYSEDIPRHDKYLIKVVETLGDEANGNYAKLAIVKVKGIRYKINEYDGWETVLTPDAMKWNIIDTPEAREMYPEYFV
jgi:hypothetical protein